MVWDEDGHEVKDKFCTICGKPPVNKCPNGHSIKEEEDQYGNDIRPNYCHECGASQYNTGVIMPFMYQHFCGRCDPDNKNYSPVNF